MDIYDRVSGPGIFIGSCILSGGLLSVAGVEGGARVTFLAVNLIGIKPSFCIWLSILRLVTQLRCYTLFHPSTLRQLPHTSLLREGFKVAF